MVQTVQIRIARRHKRKMLRKVHDLPGVLSGRLPDPNGYRDTFTSAFGHNLFTKIHKAFLTKSEGRRDDLGDFWKPLKRSTIAARPIRKGERKKLGILGLGRGGRGLLTAGENRIWKGIFASTLARLAPRVGENKAKALAARLAWGILKARGARTRLEALGGRKVPIHIVTHRLERSLQPGTLSGRNYKPPEEQIFEIGGRGVIIGTAVPYGAKLHRTRRLWPSVRKMAPWLQTATRKGVAALVQQVAKG